MGHATQKELNSKLNDARGKVDVGGLYYHHKTPDNLYRVLGLGFLEESESVAVIYQAIYELGLVWIRPMDVFLEMVDGADGKQTNRFIKARQDPK